MSQQSINFSKQDKISWLADQIFSAFPETVTGLTFYTMDCGCFYYRNKFVGGDLDPQVGIYRDAEAGLVKLVWLWMGAGKTGCLMKR